MKNEKHNLAKSALRVLILFGLFSVAFIALMGEPDEKSQWWWEQFIISKTIAAAGFYAFAKLYSRWSKTDKWLIAYNKSCDEALEAENPMQL